MGQESLPRGNPIICNDHDYYYDLFLMIVNTIPVLAVRSTLVQ